jgi:short-subunit dehydrogenase
LNVVLIARSLDKLQAVAEAIQKEHGVKAKVVKVDFIEDEDYDIKVKASSLSHT